MKMIHVRPLQNVQFCSSSRKAKILNRGIYWIFRGLKFEPDAEIGQKGTLCKGLHILNRYQKGFTLVEIIITIVVAAILGAMFLQVMETNLTGSVGPLIRVQDTFTLNEVMEKITADYKKLTIEDQTPLATLKSRIGNKDEEVTNGKYGSYTVKYNDYILFNDDDGDGIYDEVHDDGSGGNKILKVAVSIGDERLTSLFTK